MVQHYILYRGKRQYKDALDRERRRLLASDEDEGYAVR